MLCWFQVVLAVLLCNANDLWLGEYFPLLHSPASFLESCLFSNDFTPNGGANQTINTTGLDNSSLQQSIATQYLLELQAGCGDYAEDLTVPLVVLMLTRLVLTAASVSLPIPAGMFHTPIFHTTEL